MGSNPLGFTPATGASAPEPIGCYVQEQLADPLLAPDVAELAVHHFSPATLAYLGDAVYELYVRRHFLTPPKRIQAYHHQVVAQVRAERQAHHLQVLLPFLTPTEQAVLKRGRNAITSKPKRLDRATYSQATSLETLIGYLYLTDPQRLLDLLAQIDFDLPPT